MFSRNYVSFLIPMAIFNMGIQTFVVMSSYQSIDKKFKKTGQARVSLAYGLHHTGYMESMAFKHASVCCVSHYARWLSRAEVLAWEHRSVYPLDTSNFLLGCSSYVTHKWNQTLACSSSPLFLLCFKTSKRHKTSFSHQQKSHWLGLFFVENNQNNFDALVANPSVMCAFNVFFTGN